ncbi:hypothetical protein [Candidatus Kuenenia sp.]|uniref:hypothetical protein n=1 Tax=Candidatus Kuenenia sp. TaxID=2499824 RepID=UPI00321F9EA5
MRKDITFNDVLEIVDSLPEGQRETLIEIVKHRLIEERRDKLAQHIKEAKEAYAKGEVRKGSIDDLMREISK